MVMFGFLYLHALAMYSVHYTLYHAAVQCNISVLYTEYGLLEYGTIFAVQCNISVLYTEYVVRVLSYSCCTI